MTNRSAAGLAAMLATLLLLAPPGSAAAQPDEFTRIATAADRLFASGKPLVITAERLQALLTDADPANDPVLISVCAPADHAKARIKGATINMPRAAFWKPATLAKLPPKDRPIVTYCYAGTGAVGPATVLNLMGYDARQIEYGAMGWSRNDVVMGPAPRFMTIAQDYPVDKMPVATAVTWAYPVVATGRAELADILVARGDAVEAADVRAAMTAAEVQALLTDGNPVNDPFVVDARKPEDYAKGHIKGAINLPMATLFQPGNLAKLPLGRRIITVDYNGSTGVAMSYLLSILGYDSRALQYGMMGWSKDDKLIAPFKRFPADQKDYPIELGK